MNIESLEALIQRELTEIESIDNSWVDVEADVRPYIVSPYRKVLINPADNSIETYWVVFDQDMGSESEGYIVFFSESDGEFGLATKTTLLDAAPGTGIFLGVFGSFSDVLIAI